MRLADRARIGEELLEQIGKARGVGQPNRRVHQRFSYPSMTVLTAVGDCQVADWSLGGLRILGYRGKIVPTALVQVRFAFNLKRDRVHVAEAAILRGDTVRQELILKFETLPRDVFKALSEAIPSAKK